MKNSKLIELFKALNKSELREFGNYINAFSQKEKKKVIQLYDLLKSYYPHFPQKKIEKTALMQNLYPNVKGSETKKITDLMSNLSLILEEYLVIKSFRSDKLEMDKMLLKVYQQKKLNGLFLKKCEQLTKVVEKLAYKDNVFHKELYELKYMVYMHPSIEKEDIAQPLFVDINRHLNQNYFFNKLILHIEKLNRSKNWNFEIHDDEFDNDIVKFVKKNLDYENPIFVIAIKVIEALEKKEYGEYFTIKDLVTKHINLFSSRNKTNFFILLTNMAYQAYRSNLIDLAEILSVYKFGVSRGLPEINGYMPKADFNNIVSIACFLNEYEWVEDFIKTKQVLLNESVRSDTVAISWASYFFYKKDYHETLNYLNQVVFIDEQYKVTGKSLQIRAYYELKEYLAIEHLCIAVKQSMRRNKKLSDEFKTGYKNFIGFTQKLLKFHNPNIKDWEMKAEQLNKTITETINCFYKKWLVEKTEEIKKTY